MPGLAQRNGHQYSIATSTLSCSNGSLSADEFWSKHRDDVSYNQLQKFWIELSPQARQELLRIDKQSLFEQARKNMYCSRCNGLLLEGFLQIVTYGKSLQQEGASGYISCNNLRASGNQNNGDLGTNSGCQDDVPDPTVHPWGGLTATRNGTVTLLDCYLYSRSLKGLQNVFDSARARERERELLYPDACGGGGRGWISQGMAGYSRGHGTRESCALHTTRLSIDTLVDFWSALGEETRQSLLRMKEEDFIERLMYRFDSKRFCRDCRRNVIREFKELKELKRMRREPRCTSWFCVADTAFQYEVSNDTVQANWQQTFADTAGTYHHFEWAVGTGEGKSDILDFENVGLSGRVQVTGLDLGGLNACYVTLRAWKLDGRCSEFSVKAHALKGQQCIHCRLSVGDGVVTITRGESIRRFFEHAEEAEEEEDDESTDKDGNELDGECSRPQKHAKSPELAREFLLDAATVIFKEQVEKAFREGTARQNAHSIFVCLALKLLEERIHVACKEIITLEKQMKLLEEEEKEKREEEERKERKRTKEREKKLRRKERLRGKEKDREKKLSESNQNHVGPDVSREESTLGDNEEPSVSSSMDLACETGDAITSEPLFQDIQNEQFPSGTVTSNMQNLFDEYPDEEFDNGKDWKGSFTMDRSKISHRRLKFRKQLEPDSTLRRSERRRYAVVSENGGINGRSESKYYGDYFELPLRSINGTNKQLRTSIAKSNARNSSIKSSEKFHCCNNRTNDSYDIYACSCNQHSDYRTKVEPHVSAARISRESKYVNKLVSASDMSKPFYRGNKYNQIEYVRETCGRPKGKLVTVNHPSNRDLPHTRKVWEPMDSQKKYSRSNSDYDVTSGSSIFKVEPIEPNNLLKTSNASKDGTEHANELCEEDNNLEGRGNSSPLKDEDCQNGLHVAANAPHYSKETVDREVELGPAQISSLGRTAEQSLSSSSNSDSCSSCCSEGDSNTTSSNSPNPESLSTSDTEDASQHLEGSGTSVCTQNGFPEFHEVGMETKHAIDGEEAYRRGTLSGSSPGGTGNNFPVNSATAAQNDDNKIANIIMGSQHQGMLPLMHNQNVHFPIFPSPTSYYHQSPVTWPAPPVNGLMPFPNSNHYVYASPIGYGLNGNLRFMQYGALAHPHPSPSLLNPAHLPVYQSPARANGMISTEQINVNEPTGTQESYSEANTGGTTQKGQHPVETDPIVSGRSTGNYDRSHTRNSGFSLFHFGGPVALSTGYKPNSIPSEENKELSSIVSADHVEDDLACNKKDTVEEYNLFAASNGIKFPFL